MYTDHTTDVEFSVDICVLENPDPIIDLLQYKIDPGSPETKIN